MFHNINNLPQLELLSAFNSLNNLSNIDPDSNIPEQVNFKYFTSQEFADDEEINICSSGKYFSVLHFNIRSLNANLDKFSEMLIDLGHSFSVIGLTETKRQASRENIVNSVIPGYSFISQPSLLNAGGVGFYVSDNLNYSTREDLSMVTMDFETLWIEIQSDLHHNIICGVVYRHPNSNMDNFMDYLNSIADKLNRTNKYCLIMGDLNINLLKQNPIVLQTNFSIIWGQISFSLISFSRYE